MIEPLRGVEIDERAFALMHVEITDAAPFVRLRQFGIEPKRFGEIVNRAREIVQALVHQPAVGIDQADRPAAQ